MRIKIRSTFAVGSTQGLRDLSGARRELAVDVAPGTTVEELLRIFPYLGPASAFDDMMLTVLVNGRVRGFDHVLGPENVIDLHIPVSGG